LTSIWSNRAIRKEGRKDNKYPSKEKQNPSVLKIDRSSFYNLESSPSNQPLTKAPQKL
jgi:hypothetical protein